jgi:GT2 family glycosyltransferase
MQSLDRLSKRWLPPGTYRRKVFVGLVRSGLRLARALRRLTFGRRPSPAAEYRQWIRRYEPNRKEQESEGREPVRPRFTLLALADAPPGAPTRAMLRSVLGQTYDNWELVLAVPMGREQAFRDVVRLAGGADERLRVLPLEGGGFAERAGAALARARGDHVALIGADDALAPAALATFARAVADRPEADLLYSDEDGLSAGGRRVNPIFKPDWAPDTLRGHNYIGRLAAVSRPLLERIGGFRPGFGGAAEYDLVLRATEQARAIVHVPHVLYHRREVGPRLLLDRPETDAEGEKKALAEHLRRAGMTAEVREGAAPGTWHVAYPLARRPLVSVIIPNRDEPEALAKCVASVFRSRYAHRELLIVENGSRRPETFAYYRTLERHANVRLLTWQRPFNYAAINNWAAALARGEVLLLLNNDVEAINADWIERMLEHALRPEVGAVGAKLYYPDDTIQHAGVGLGIHGVAGHVYRGYPRHARGPGNRLVTVQNVSAVTAACLMLRRDVYREAGGLDEDFAVTMNDIDLCLKLRCRGYAVLWTPFAELYHFESRTRGPADTLDKRVRLEKEADLMHLKWGPILRQGDPFYSPNLTLLEEDCSLRFHDGLPGIDAA